MAATRSSSSVEGIVQVVEVLGHGIDFLVELREAHLLVRRNGEKHGGAFAAFGDADRLGIGLSHGFNEL